MDVQGEVLKREVRAELEREPSLAGAAVEVSVAHDGVVTLTGVVGSYAGKVAAERAVERVTEVHAVVNDLDVKLAASHERTDTDLAEAVVHALEWDVTVPDEKIHVRVSDGWVRLEGEVGWRCQRAAAEEAIRNLTGITGVTNLITVRPKVVVGG